MAPTLSNVLSIALLLVCAGLANAETRVFNFTANWVNRNPDGMFNRRTMALNGQWPIPVMNVTKGDRVIVHLYNDLGDQDVSLHFHGLYQNGTSHMDGPAGVTQCPVPPGSSFTYDFRVDQPGTYWYHSHVRGQYPDGIRGPLLVQDPENPYKGAFDEEILMSLSDWYHEQMPTLLAQFISYTNPTGAEPVPNSALMNETQNFQVKLDPGKTYFFRIVNMAAFAAQYLWFEGHTMEIIEVDGIYTKRQPADMIYITAAQRYGVLIKAKSNAQKNFAIVGSMDQDLFDVVPEGLNPNVTGHLVYNENMDMPKAMDVDAFEPYDDVHLVPYDEEPIFEEPTQILKMTMAMGNLGDGANYAFINDVTYTIPKVPTLYTTLSTGAMASDPGVYGANTQPFIVNHNEVVEIQFNNNDPGKHPFHLHGHAFQVVYRSGPGAGSYNSSIVPASNFRQTPMKRDTLWVRPNGNFVIRFRSDNPVATIIEAPMALQQQLMGKIPQNHYDVCREGNRPYEGNAAGNTKELLNLEGANLPPPPLPAGFTARGIVALVFSCISAFLGMVMIGWYGLRPLGSGPVAGGKAKIVKSRT